MNTNMAKELAETISRKRKMEREIKALSKRVRELEAPILDEMAIEGVPRLTINIDDGSTVTLSPSTIERCGLAQECTKQQVAGALVASGLGDLVKQDFNFNSLSALLREARGDGGDLPDTVLNLLDIREDVSIRATFS